MDPPLKKEKLEATNKYKKQQLLHNFILHSLTAFTCSLFCSSPFWFPSFLSSMKVFLFVSLPNITSLFFNPKFLFIVGNLIVVVLVGESKLMGSSSSPTSDILYDQYVKRKKSLEIRLNAPEEKTVKEGKLEISLTEESSLDRVEEIGVEEKGEEILEEENLEKGREEDIEGEEDICLLAEELNKRVEDFIARVKTQRRLEAQLPVSTCA